jgi:formylglycine-generating enzyme required for sulfatase activity
MRHLIDVKTDVQIDVSTTASADFTFPRRTPRADADMVWVPGTEFVMGSDAHYPEEAPAHRVWVDGFHIDRFPVTNARFRRFVDLHMHMPSNWTLGRAAALRTSVEQALMSAVPGLRATIQLLPSDVEAHFDDEEDLI